MLIARTLVRFLLVLAAASPASADVLTVGPSGLFNEIQPALNASADGDTVLIEPSGTYAAFTIPDRDLSIVGDGPVIVNGTIVLNGLGPGRSVLISDLRSPSLGGNLSLTVSNAIGSVRVDGCTFRGVSLGGIFFGSAGVVVEQSADVAFTSCTIRGGINGHGIDVRASQISVVDSSVTGGFADDGGFGLVIAGPAGMFVDDGATCFLGASTITGGSGSIATYPFTPSCYDVGDGGVGLHLDMGLVRVRATQLLGAPASSGSRPGVGCPLGGSDGAAGAPSFVSPLGTLVSLAGPQPFLTLPTTQREGQHFVASFGGAPGDLIGLTWNSAAATAWWPGLGQQLVSFQPVLKLRLAGMVPAEGLLSIPLQVGELGPGVDEGRLFLQVLSASPSGPVTLGSARPLVLLDASF